jgi:fumarylacetoacetase
MFELTWDGDINNPLPGSQRSGLKLPTGEERKFLADGDEVTLKGFCVNDHYRRIGLGVCAGTIQPAISM